jgi:protein-disulfide isomerase
VERSSKRVWFAIAAAAAVLGGSLVAASALRGDVNPKPARAPVRAALLRGVPQHGLVLGSPAAPVTLVEFADLQCPYCGEFARDAMPELIRQYVRTGRVRIVFAGLEFIGVDSDTALRAVIAAGFQHRAWDLIDALYGAQGIENGGWVTSDFLRRIGRAVPGIDVERMLRESTSPAVAVQLAADRRLAAHARVRGTPTFFAGRRGAPLRLLHLSALSAAAVEPSLDALLRR